MTKPLQIASNFVVMSDSFDADTIEVSDTMYAELDRKYAGFSGHLLIASHSFEKDWPTWEVHPKGDEFVILIRVMWTWYLRLKTATKRCIYQNPGRSLLCRVVSGIRPEYTNGPKCCSLRRVKALTTRSNQFVMVVN